MNFLNKLLVKLKHWLFESGNHFVDLTKVTDEERDLKEHTACSLVSFIKQDLVTKAKEIPLVTLDGKPNPNWADIFSIGFPNLLREEIENKQLELIETQTAVIDAFLDKVEPGLVDDWIEQLEPELRLDELGSWHVKINGQWNVLANPTYFNR